MVAAKPFMETSEEDFRRVVDINLYGSRNVAEATSTAGFNQTYGDYLLMYSALAGEEARVAALEEARALDAVDDGNTRTYLLAWLMSLKA